MKKIIASLALAGMSVVGLTAASSDYTGESVDDLSITGTFGFETEYVFRGKERAQQSFQPSIELGFPILGGDLYGGMWTNLPVNSAQLVNADGNFTASPYGSNNSEIDFYIGYAYTIEDIVTLDVGYTYYWYPEAGDGFNSFVSRSNEIFFGVSLDVLLNPSVYYYYDFNLQQNVVEGSIGYSFDLSQATSMQGFSLDLGGYLGYLSADRFAGDQTGPQWSNGYVYLGTTVDLVYNFSENVSSSVGARWSLNNDGRETGSALTSSGSQSLGPQQNVWFGASIGFAY